MAPDWAQLLRQIKGDHASGASALLGRAIEATRLFLIAARAMPPARLLPALARFTQLLVDAQPSMAPLLTLANALWLGVESRPAAPGEALHDALVQYADETDRVLLATIRHAAGLLRSNSLVVTYSNSTAVRMALRRAVAAGRRFQVVCSESRPTREGLSLAKSLADAGIPVHLVADAALPAWTEKAHLVLVGADAVVMEGVVNKIGTRPLVRASRDAGVPAFVLADSRKWLAPRLQVFWRVREESPRELTTMRRPNLHVHNRYFDLAPHGLFAGLVWERGVIAPGKARRMIARLPVAEAVGRILRPPAEGQDALGERRYAAHPSSTEE